MRPCSSPIGLTDPDVLVVRRRRMGIKGIQLTRAFFWTSLTGFQQMKIQVYDLSLVMETKKVYHDVNRSD